MPIRFACPACGKNITAPDERAGSTAKCPGCRTPLQIPSPAIVTEPRRKKGLPLWLQIVTFSLVGVSLCCSGTVIVLMHLNQPNKQPVVSHTPPASTHRPEDKDTPKDGWKDERKDRIVRKDGSKQASPRATDTLSDDYFPSKAGTLQHRMTFVYVPGGSLKFKDEYLHQKDGTIQIRCLESKAQPKGGRPEDMPLKTTSRLHYQTKDGFIEIGEESEPNKKLVWKPVIKIGAKVGDSWERETWLGEKLQYKVVKFDVEKKEDNGWPQDIPIAVVEERSSPKPFVYVKTTQYGLGLGPLEIEMNEETNGGLKKLWWSRQVRVLR